MQQAVVFQGQLYADSFETNMIFIGPLFATNYAIKPGDRGVAVRAIYMRDARN